MSDPQPGLVPGCRWFANTTPAIDPITFQISYSRLILLIALMAFLALPGAENLAEAGI